MSILETAFAQHLNDGSGSPNAPEYTIFALQVCSIYHLIFRPYFISSLPKGDQIFPLMKKSVYKIK